MLRFFREFLNGKKQLAPHSIPEDFPSYARKAIELLAASNGQLSDEEIVTLLTDNAIPKPEAVELLLFLPTAFCRHMLPAVNWPIYYIEFVSEQKQTKVLYTDNLRFVAIQQAMLTYLAGPFKQADFLKIASRSAAFKAINDLLTDNPTFNPEDVELTPEYIVC